VSSFVAISQKSGSDAGGVCLDTEGLLLLLRQAARAPRLLRQLVEGTAPHMDTTNAVDGNMDASVL
jgi:hypothetical protein